MASKTGGKARVVGSGQHDQWWQRNQELLNPVVLTILSAMTRFYRIGKSNFVVWDEAHFGKFGAHYVNHTFYHDVHPPLAKMLVGLSEILTGFDGSFRFPSGETYPENVNYRFLRIFNASFGVPLAPFAYVTLRNLGCSMNAALLGGLLVCFDNALCTISRFILLDAMLLCFTAMSAMCLSGVYKHRKQPFTVPWYKWMFMTGVSLGLVTSSKWVGFFAVALVGLYTVYELYDLLELPETRPSNYLMHWLVRGAALIVIPVTIYLACFKVHFALLYKSGPGDAEMDSLFQANLQGTNLQNQPLDVAFGSKVTIKNALQGVGLLHSHVDQYPGGSQQQQITCYSHKDSNNDWILKKVHGQTYGNTSETVEFIKNGDIVRLVHERTTRNLHSHQVKAHVAKREWEVTGYGMDSKWNDPNDHWRVEVVQDLSHSNPNKHLRTLASRFRLRHVQQGCLLRASGKSLPQWGWKQAEIVCDRSGKIDDNSVWNIENHVNPLLPNARPGELRSSFLRDFVRLNKAMARTNNALLPDPDKFDSLTSAPYEWPIMRLGLRMCGWNDNRVKFWLTGNPVVWWLSSLAVFIAGPIQILYFAIRSQRGIDDFNGNPGALENYALVSAILWGGWALHYLPFFIMGRVTYLHHYFPAVYFAAMYLAFLLEWNAARLSGSVTSRMNKTVLAVLGLAAIANFMFFAPFTFGFDYPAKELANRKWISTWNIYDGHD
ncbi:PMT-domain-containing protein [Linderina pennispora]|uniref:Dolichyl-phosphate-mannose--protein mannosyltransferase n=1 Tax=Linderina pennispora TaxID=61395 RepID=A0A1Y1WFQ7_9FUNG|nr:PMT-domain-containing protein [Linderina pennispora]ORX71974.1 PMT-domain-containing protein [Linderina pennispora]